MNWFLSEWPPASVAAYGVTLLIVFRLMVFLKIGKSEESWPIGRPFILVATGLSLVMTLFFQIAYFKQTPANWLFLLSRTAFLVLVYSAVLLPVLLLMKAVFDRIGKKRVAK